MGVDYTMSDYKLRDCSEIIEILQDGTHDQELNYINELSDRKDLFIGIRHQSIKVYSYGAMIIEVTYKKNKGFLFNTNPIFAEGVALPMDINDCKKYFEKILERARDEYINQSNNEKICQQWIVDANNNNPESPYYYVDMEYNTQGTRLGRFDIIAISKDKNKSTGKHSLHLIELKVGDKSYTGSWEKDDAHKEFLSNENAIFDDGKDNQYKHPLKFGSGIVGHITDYIRFLNNDKFYNQLRENVCSILNCKKRLGCLDSIEDIGNISVEDIDLQPQIIILTYTNVPEEASNGKKLLNNEKKDVEQLIIQMKKYLFNGKGNSEYNLEDHVNPKVIDGFIKLKNNTISNNTHVSQKIGGREYDFVLRFIDADAEGNWKCIF